MKSLLHNKKGAITDPIMVGAFILLTCMTIVIALYVWFQFQAQMVIVVADSHSNETIVGVMNELSATYVSIDYMIPLMVGGLMLVSLIFAFKTGANVVYAFLSLVMWAFAMLMAAVFTNIFETFSANFPAIIALVPILDYVMMNMKWITLAWVFLISVIMFSRNKQDDQKISQAEAQYYG